MYGILISVVIILAVWAWRSYNANPVAAQVGGLFNHFPVVNWPLVLLVGCGLLFILLAALSVAGPSPMEVSEWASRGSNGLWLLTGVTLFTACIHLLTPTRGKALNTVMTVIWLVLVASWLFGACTFLYGMYGRLEHEKAIADQKQAVIVLEQQKAARLVAQNECGANGQPACECQEDGKVVTRYMRKGEQVSLWVPTDGRKLKLDPSPSPETIEECNSSLTNCVTDGSEIHVGTKVVVINRSGQDNFQLSCKYHWSGQ